jgi:uroporphyrinogen decarboxylase
MAKPQKADDVDEINTPPNWITLAERINAVMSGQRPDRVPFMPFVRGFCAVNVGYPIASYYTDAEKSFWAQIWTQEQYGYDGYPIFSWAIYGAWEFGGEVKLPTSQWDQSPSVVRYPVESEEDVKKLELPDVKTAGMLPLTMEFSKLQKKHGLPAVPCGGSPFTRAANLCGLDKLCRWTKKRPEVAHTLLRLMTDHLVEVAQYWVDTFGAEHVIPFSGNPCESNTIISPNHFEKFALPYMKELHEKVLGMGVRGFQCHICGEQNLNLPYLAQVPMGNAGLVSFGHEVDPNTAIKYFGGTCIIAGNVDPAVIQTGTPQQVYELSRQCIEKGKYAPRGYMLSTGCELPPYAPPYNVYMMMKAVKDFGWYE